MNLRHGYRYPRLAALFLTTCLLVISESGLADAVDLYDKYKALTSKLADNSFGVPIHLEASNQKRTLQGDVYGIIHHPFARVRQALTTPANWCDIMQQHINIKACTHRPVKNECTLTLYSGRKYYRKPEDVYRLDYSYTLVSLQENYFRTMLTADKGPLDTKGYRITLEAIPLTATSSFIHFSYRYQYGFATRVAMAGYFTTLGHNKVGFTVVANDEHGQPLYVDGIQGVVERNSMRYYLAIQAFLDTQQLQPSIRFERRINHWFDLTAKHRPQLDELEKQDYLTYKRKEQADQQRLQLAINDNTERSVCQNNGLVRERVSYLQ